MTDTTTRPTARHLRRRPPLRRTRHLLVVAVLGATIAGCGAAPAPRTTPASTASPDASAGPGWTIVNAPDGPDAPHLRITTGALTLGKAGAAPSLTVRIANTGAVEDHLVGVRLPAAATVGQLTTTTPSTVGGGEGIPIPAGTTTAIGPNQSWRVTFPTTGDLQAEQTTRLLLDFTVAGQVSLTTPVLAAQEPSRITASGVAADRPKLPPINCTRQTDHDGVLQRSCRGLYENSDSSRVSTMRWLDAARKPDHRVVPRRMSDRLSKVRPIRLP